MTGSERRGVGAADREAGRPAAAGGLLRGRAVGYAAPAAVVMGVACEVIAPSLVPGRVGPGQDRPPQRGPADAGAAGRELTPVGPSRRRRRSGTWSGPVATCSTTAAGAQRLSASCCARPGRGGTKWTCATGRGSPQESPRRRCRRRWTPTAAPGGPGGRAARGRGPAGRLGRAGALAPAVARLGASAARGADRPRWPPRSWTGAGSPPPGRMGHRAGPPSTPAGPGPGAARSARRGPDRAGGAAWAYRHRPAVGALLRRRQAGADPGTLPSWKAQQRLHATWRKMAARGSPRRHGHRRRPRARGLVWPR